MKKTAKSVLLFMVMAMLLLALTGCGNKIVATKDSDEGKETIEIKFKGDKADKVTMSYTFKDKDDAEETEKAIKSLFEDKDGIKITRSGKKITIKMDIDAYAELYGGKVDTLSKDEIKENLEKAGYDVK